MAIAHARKGGQNQKVAMIGLAGRDGDRRDPRRSDASGAPTRRGFFGFLHDGPLFDLLHVLRVDPAEIIGSLVPVPGLPSTSTFVPAEPTALFDAMNSTPYSGTLLPLPRPARRPVVQVPRRSKASCCPPPHRSTNFSPALPAWSTTR
jgi:hypothetical protein